MYTRNNDFHSALKTEIINKVKAEGIEVAILKLQYSRDNIAYSLHANSNVFSLSGLQRSDLFLLLGLENKNCSIFPGGECYTTWIEESFPLNDFANEFKNGYNLFCEAERNLSIFGLMLRGRSPQYRTVGDGHSAMITKDMKKFKDEIFTYQLSWIEGESGKGWTYHYFPNHPPFSNEVKSSLKFLDLKRFDECPYFDFEPCYWQFIPFKTGSRAITGSNAHIVNDTFLKHPKHFSLGIENLVRCHSVFAKYGFDLLPVVDKFSETKKPQIKQSLIKKPIDEYEFDVAISFAGPQRNLAEKLAKKVRYSGYVPFYDDFYPEHLWGKDLVVFFDEIYRKKSKFCVIFVSDEYCNRMWTNHERKSAQARALEEKGNEYILPIKVDESELPGMPSTIGYVALNNKNIEEIGDLLIKKLSNS